MRLNFTVTIRNDETGVERVERLQHHTDDEGVFELDVSWVQSGLREQALDVRDQAVAKLKEVESDGLTIAQRRALVDLSERYKVPFNRDNFRHTHDLPTGYVAGWVGPIYVGCSPEGGINS